MKQITSVPFSRPSISSQDIDTVAQVLRSGILSMGDYIEKFEAAVANYTQVKHAVAVSSGTAGLHLAVLASQLPEHSEIITTPFSFIPSANRNLYGNYRPVFVDIELNSLGPDPYLIDAALTPKSRAILFADLFYQPVDTLPLRSIARRHGLLLIEDAREALGACSRGTRAGALGDIGVFGFYPNRQITTGEGGMIVTNNADFASRCRSLRNHGRAPHNTWLTHDDLGFNYRLNEMSAALGYSQMQRIETFIALREQAAQYYLQCLRGVDGISLPQLAKATNRASWFAFTLQLDNKLCRDTVRKRLAAYNVPSRDYFYCIHLQKPYREKFGYRAGQFPVAENFARQNLALPIFPDMQREQIEYVCNSLAAAIAESQ